MPVSLKMRSAWTRPLGDLTPALHFDSISAPDRDRSRSPIRRSSGLNTPTSEISILDFDVGPWFESPPRTPEGIPHDILMSIPRTPPTPPGGFPVNGRSPVTPPELLRRQHQPVTPPELLQGICTPEIQ